MESLSNLLLFSSNWTRFHSSLSSIAMNLLAPLLLPLPPCSLQWVGRWAMNDNPNEVSSDFGYYFTLPDAYGQQLPPGHVVPAVPLLPSSPEHPIVSMPYAGYYKMWVAPDRPPAHHEEGDAKGSSSGSSKSGGSKSGGGKGSFVLRIGGPVPTDEVIPKIVLPDGSEPPASALLGIRATGFSAALKKKFELIGAYHPPTGTAYALKVFEAIKPQGTPRVRAPAPAPAPASSAGGSAEKANSMKRSIAGLSSDAIQTAQRQRRSVQPPRAAVSPGDGASSSSGLTSRGKPRLSGEQGALQEVLEAVMADPYAAGFLAPVDPVALAIPDYPDIVKNVSGSSACREFVCDDTDTRRYPQARTFQHSY